MKKHFAHLVSAFFIVMTCLMGTFTSAWADDTHTPLEPIDCPGTRGEGEYAVCFILHVPSDWGDISNRSMELPVMRFAPLGEKATKPPLLLLAGGPGQSAIRLEKHIAKNLKQFRQDRELILMDQRGTGPFADAVRCSEAIGEKDQISADEIAHCIKQAEDQGLFLSDYRTDFAVQDYRALRYALKIEKWAIIANSYGARVAQGLIDVDDKGIERVIFNGPLFIGTRFFDWNPGDKVEKVVEICNELDACREMFPNLYWDYQRLPFAMRGVKLDADALPAVIQPMLYRNRLQALLARHRLIDVPDDIEKTSRSLQQALENDAIWTPPSPMPQSMRGIGLLMHFAIICAEDIKPFEDRLLSDLDQPLQVAFYRSVCERIEEETDQIVKLKDGWDQAKTSQKPILIINGEFDTIVDPSAAEATLPLYPNAKLVTVPYLGHDQVSQVPCSRQIAFDFLQGASVTDLDVSCIETIHPNFRAPKPLEAEEQPTQ